MIRVENLTKHFGDVKAVNGLSFEVFEGEILGFLGPNGAGKTTTMRILTGFFPPSSGSATIAGFDVVAEPDEVRRVIGYMPEGVPLYREMSVSDFLDFVAHAKGYGKAARRKHVAAAMEETNLGDVRHRLVGELSKGFRQRVGLAQAILGEPRVLILDEPTSGLDPRQIADMRALIKGMAGRRTVILSTHILPEVQMTCSRVIIINQGKIAASGTPEKLTTRMQNRFQTVAWIIGPPNEVIECLNGLSGVQSVSHRPPARPEEGAVRGFSGQAHEFTVVTGIEYPDARPAVAAAAVSKGWTLVELRQVGLSLEDIFLRTIAGEVVSSAPGARAAGDLSLPASQDDITRVDDVAAKDTAEALAETSAAGETPAAPANPAVSSEPTPPFGVPKVATTPLAGAETEAAGEADHGKEAANDAN